MTNKIKIYFGLLVLILALVGGSLWLKLNSSPKIKIPTEPPIIAAESLYSMGGMIDKVFIYEDGTIISVEDRGLRPTLSKTRTWKTGQLSKEELNTISLLFQSENFTKMKDSYDWLATPYSDLMFTITINSQSVNKTVTASGYRTYYQDTAIPEMPYPLNGIYLELRQVVEKNTRVVSTETKFP